MAHRDPDQKRPRDPYLVTLLGEPENPTREEYANKKVTLARKMDRLEFTSKCRLNFIKTLHANNEAKALSITSFNDKRLRAESDNGLKEAEDLFYRQKSKHEKVGSIKKRLDLLHKYCIYTEVSASQGYLKESDMDPVPTPSLFPSLEFDSMLPGYKDLLSNAPSPFKGEFDKQTGQVLDTVDPLLSGTMMMPYQLPLVLREKSRKKKFMIKKQLEIEKLEKEKARKEALLGQKIKAGSMSDGDI